MKLAFAVATAFWLVGATSSSAALSTADSRFGPNTLVEDSMTRLDWLVLPISQGFSVNQVLTAIAPGGSLEEFRLATQDELVALLTSLDIPINISCVGACFTSGQQFVSLFQGNGGLLAPVAVVEPDVVELFSFHLSLYAEITEALADLQLVSRNPAIAFGADRFFLVADQPVTVPEPSALAILLSSLGLLAIGARRQCRASSTPRAGLYLGSLMRTLALPKTVETWSLTSLREKLIKIGAKVVRHGRYITFQLAEAQCRGRCSSTSCR